MPLQVPLSRWDINEVNFTAYAEKSFGNNDTSPTQPVNGGIMYRRHPGYEWTEAWPTREAAKAAAAKAAAEKLKPTMDTYYDDEPGAGNKSSTFYDGLSGLLNGGVDIAGKVAGIANAFRGGTASPDAQRVTAELKKTQDAGNSKTYWIIGGIGAAVLVVLFFFLRRK